MRCLLRRSAGLWWPLQDRYRPGAADFTVGGRALHPLHLLILIMSQSVRMGASRLPHRFGECW